MKRLLCALLTLCAVPLWAADSTINNLGAKTTIPDTYVMPWEDPGVLDWHITFLNLTNQILAGMASQVYAQGLTNGFITTASLTGQNLVVSNLTASASITATNMITGSYGCLIMSTGQVTVATSASTNLFTAYNYTNTFGSIGIETNSSFVVTNACRVRVSFGASLLGSNADTVTAAIYTNGVDCGIVRFTKVMQSPAIAETGFKEFTMAVPALCRISVYIGNTAAANVNVQNLCFNVKGAN